MLEFCEYVLDGDFWKRGQNSFQTLSLRIQLDAINKMGSSLYLSVSMKAITRRDHKEGQFDANDFSIISTMPTATSQVSRLMSNK